MKKLFVFIMILSCSLNLFGCSQKEQNEKLTLDKVIELSSKGMSLTLDDFENYETIADHYYDRSIETGSGLFVMGYDIDESFELWIGSETLDDLPLYIRLSEKNNPNNRIDIRRNNVKKFVDSCKKTIE